MKQLCSTDLMNIPIGLRKIGSLLEYNGGKAYFRLHSIESNVAYLERVEKPKAGIMATLSAIGLSIAGGLFVSHLIKKQKNCYIRIGTKDCFQ